MNDLNCENVSMAAMAIADGYQPELSSELIEIHLAACDDCRRELGELLALCKLLDTQERRPAAGNLWETIEPRLPKVAHANASTVLPAFMFLGFLLLVYRLVELIPDRDFGFVFKFVPVLLVVVAFSFLRENPFKINSELQLEGELLR